MNIIEENVLNAQDVNQEKALLEKLMDKNLTKFFAPIMCLTLLTTLPFIATLFTHGISENVIIISLFFMVFFVIMATISMTVFFYHSTLYRIIQRESAVPSRQTKITLKILLTLFASFLIWFMLYSTFFVPGINTLNSSTFLNMQQLNYL